MSDTGWTDEASESDEPTQKAVERPQVLHYECSNCGHRKDIDVSDRALLENDADYNAGLIEYERLVMMRTPEAKMAAMQQEADAQSTRAERQANEDRQQRADAMRERDEMRQRHPYANL
jgi:hypothetical protein